MKHRMCRWRRQPDDFVAYVTIPWLRTLQTRFSSAFPSATSGLRLTGCISLRLAAASELGGG